jgi:hypothetical protein
MCSPLIIELYPVYSRGRLFMEFPVDNPVFPHVVGELLPVRKRFIHTNNANYLANTLNCLRWISFKLTRVQICSGMNNSSSVVVCSWSYKVRSTMGKSEPSATLCFSDTARLMLYCEQALAWLFFQETFLLTCQKK